MVDVEPPIQFSLISGGLEELGGTDHLQETRDSSVETEASSFKSGREGHVSLGMMCGLVELATAGLEANPEKVLNSLSKLADPRVDWEHSHNHQVDQHPQVGGSSTGNQF